MVTVACSVQCYAFPYYVILLLEVYAVQSKSKLLVHFLVLALLHFDGCSLVLQGLTGCRRCIVFFH